MAYWRTITQRATPVVQRCRRSFSYVPHSDDRDQQPQRKDLFPAESSYSFKRTLLGTNIKRKNGFGVSFQSTNSWCSMLLLHSGYSFCPRYMSTSIEQETDKTEVIRDVAEVVSDTTMQAIASQAPAVSEVAMAAADSYLPVKGLQYLIDSVHSVMGLNWWAAIAATTILMRTATIPLLIYQLKSTTKLTLIRPRLEEIKQEINDQGMDPRAVAEGQVKMKALFREHGVSPFTPLMGLFIQGPLFISFFLAIRNMADKMQSFKIGGAYWFVDLTTPDTLYVLPVLTGLSFLITVEFKEDSFAGSTSISVTIYMSLLEQCNMQEGLEGNPIAGTMKNISRFFAVATVPLTMGFPKAIFCYWITSNLYSLFYGLALKAPGVKKFLDIPEIPTAPSSTPSRESSFSVFPALKQAALKQASPVTQEEVKHTSAPSKVPDHKISSYSVMNQRIKTLERQVKGRKNNKKK